jgi:hypothetical protein
MVIQFLRQLWVIALTLRYTHRDRENQRRLDRRLASLRDTADDTDQVP